MEMLHDFCVWKVCVIFLTRSLRFHDLFFWRLRDFFLVKKVFLTTTVTIVTTVLWRDCMIFFAAEVVWFFLRGCVILFVERLRDFCVWRGCVIFLTHSLRLQDLFFWRLHDFSFCYLSAI